MHMILNIRQSVGVQTPVHEREAEQTFHQKSLCQSTNILKHSCILLISIESSKLMGDRKVQQNKKIADLS